MYTGFGDYYDSDGNLVASNVSTPSGSPSPLPTTSQGPVVSASPQEIASDLASLGISSSFGSLTNWLSANSTAVFIGVGALVALVFFSGGRRR